MIFASDRSDGNDGNVFRPVFRSGESGFAASLPSPVSKEDFQLLIEKSPFTRMMNLSDTLVLTGVAHIDGKKDGHHSRYRSPQHAHRFSFAQ